MPACAAGITKLIPAANPRLLSSPPLFTRDRIATGVFREGGGAATALPARSERRAWKGPPGGGGEPRAGCCTAAWSFESRPERTERRRKEEWTESDVVTAARSAEEAPHKTSPRCSVLPSSKGLKGSIDNPGFNARGIVFGCV